MPLCSSVVVISVLIGERKRGSLRVIFPSPGQMLKTAMVDDFLEVQISFTVKKPVLPSSGKVSNY